MNKYTFSENEYSGEFEGTDYETLRDFQELEDAEYMEFEGLDEFENREEFESMDEFEDAGEYGEWEWGVGSKGPGNIQRTAPIRIVVSPVQTLHGFCFNEYSLMERHIKEIYGLAVRIVALSRRGPITVRLVGHTDSVGNAARNQKLGLMRAQAVGRKLRLFLSRLLNKVQRGGARLGKISIVEQSLGEKRPVSPASNRTEMGRAKNRRVQIFFSQPPAP